MLKAGGARVRVWLVRLFAAVWASGRVPEEWKRGIVVPLYKKGDRMDVANYRGITLMVVAAKVLERVLLCRLREVREARCRETQAGFRPGRSCGEQVFALRRVLEERAEWGLPVVAVALDFASAYDSVDRRAVLQVMENEGVLPGTLRVLRALMEGCDGMVRVAGELSAPFRQERGVRQGSVVSPVLFVALMDWVLARALDGLGVGVEMVGAELGDLCFADDVLLLGRTVASVQVAVDAVAAVGRRVGLVLNAKKTVWVARGEVGLGNVVVEGQSVERAGSLVYLGSEMGPDGGMAGEVGRRVAAASASFWRLRRLWRDRGVSVAVKARVYSAVVRGVLLYGVESWPLREADCRRLEVFDRGRIRYLLGVRLTDRVSVGQLLARAGVRGLGQLIVERRWRWLGHVMRMGEERVPRRCLLWTGKEVDGATRRRGGCRLTWLRLVLREGWEAIPWDSLGERKPHWVRWTEGLWRRELSELAANRDRWRAVVAAVVRRSECCSLGSSRPSDLLTN